MTKNRTTPGRAADFMEAEGPEFVRIMRKALKPCWWPLTEKERAVLDAWLRPRIAGLVQKWSPT